ncbi:MAG: VWA domain-containing protein [Pseudomonadota bacterium]|nr:VWA domain-containing protein [Pseudomonadota bacterium]
MTAIWQSLLQYFAWPWMLLLMPLPLLLRRLWPARPDEALPALRWPQAAQLPVVPGVSKMRPGFNGLAAIAWLLLCIAAARPQTLGPLQAPPQTGRDLMLAVDISGSMAQQDMRLGGRAVDRLTAAKAVLEDFLERRASDRVGLIVFGQRAYAIAPLTRDRESVRSQLREAMVGMAGRETAIGDAIGLAIKRLHAQPAEQRVLIVLTDGENTAGVLTPAKAAELARAENVRIHTIAFGGDGDTLSVLGIAISLPGMQAGIDEASLQQVAALTGGQFFRARDAKSLAGIYAEIDRLEPSSSEGQALRPRIEHYWRWLLAASLMAMLGGVSGQWRRRA